MKVELSIHASRLKNVAGLGKGTSDPFAVVTQIATVQDSKPHVLGRTETIKNTLSPNWVKTVTFDYNIGTPMKVAITIFDEVKKGENKSMGAVVFDIGEVLGARGSTKAKKLKDNGTVFAHVRKSTAGAGVLRLKLKGSDLKNIEGFMRKSDPFYELSRRIDSAGGATWDNVLRSNVVKDNLNPMWDEAAIELSLLCGGARDHPILLTVYDYESDGKHKLMGKLETSVNGLVKAAGNSSALALVGGKKGKESGSIIVEKADVADEITEKVSNLTVAASATSSASFVDYINGGCHLNVCVAIDFTGSNGDPRKPGTLHYIHQDGSRNDYEKAISAIVGILEKYDYDKQFPVYGFGAKYDGVVRHCFQCGRTEEVHCVQGVLDAYRSVFQSGLIMSGPTVFTDVIDAAAARAATAQEAAQRKGEQSYTILLIVTDGSVSDMVATATALEKASNAPLSVVIVGVGNADFGAMRFLDDASLPGKRDIAQFVEFNKHSRSSVDLTSETLNEIPNQLVSYFTSNGIQPQAAVHRDDSEIVIEPEEEEIDLSLAFEDDEEIVVSGGGSDYRDAF